MRNTSRARSTYCRPPRGMAFIAVIMTFVLIGAAIVAMMTLFATQVKLTRAATGGAQLRQLLMAGTVFAGEQLRTDGAHLAPHDAEIPTPLANATLHLQITPDGPGAANVRILVAFRDQRAAQLLHFDRQGSAWLPTAATLHE